MVWFAMSLFYIFAGIFLAVRQLIPPPSLLGQQLSQESFNIGAGAILIGYGLFRLLRAFKTIKKNEI